MKKIFLIIGGCLLIASAYAVTTDWIDYSTGKYGCTNGFRGQTDFCRVDSGVWMGGEYCRKSVKDICE